MKKPNILKTLTPDQALTILKLLAKENKSFKGKIEQLARDYLGQVDTEETAAEVFLDLESLDVHDVWDQAGPDSYGGYQDPGEVAWDMVEETLETYINQFKKYLKLKMIAQAKKYYQGIIKGIENYQRKSRSQFKDYAEDALSEKIDIIIDIWNKSGKKSKRENS